jgi:hypothetical protein
MKALLSILVAIVALLEFSTPLNALAANQLDQGLALFLPLTQDLQDHSPAKLEIQNIGNVRIEKEGAFFGGRRDWLQAPHIALNDRPFAVAVWIREISDEHMVGLLEQFDRNQGRRHFSLMLRDNQPYFWIYDRNMISPLNVSRDKEWTHLVFQYTGKELQIWINGRLICSEESPSYLGDHGVTAIGKMPRWTNTSGKDFVGYMRDFRIYQRILSPEEISELGGLTKPAQTSIATASAPNLSADAIKSRDAMLQFLPEDKSLPLLQIVARQVVINKRAGQIYTFQSSGYFDDWQPVATSTNQTGAVTYEFPNGQPTEVFRLKVEGFEP